MPTAVSGAPRMPNLPDSGWRTFSHRLVTFLSRSEQRPIASITIIFFSGLGVSIRETCVALRRLDRGLRRGASLHTMIESIVATPAYKRSKGEESYETSAGSRCSHHGFGCWDGRRHGPALCSGRRQDRRLWP